ncbi:hypothetical protein [Paenibacillus kribbensis]|uniref:hypothetical protein n=1 Tax=Paenibacillus kribbensis TaxID=172713 RepID=UPI00114D25A7|nr:hypothetical protein [Paenibacillus kribbensis]
MIQRRNQPVGCFEDLRLDRCPPEPGGLPQLCLRMHAATCKSSGSSRNSTKVTSKSPKSHRIQH